MQKPVESGDTLSFEQPGILKARIFREFYGAYFTSELDAYHFDASTGQLITLRQLLYQECRASIAREHAVLDDAFEKTTIGSMRPRGRYLAIAKITIRTS